LIIIICFAYAYICKTDDNNQLINKEFIFLCE